MNKQKFLIQGAGGHAKVVVDVVDKMSNAEVQGIFDDHADSSKRVLDYPVLGDAEKLVEAAKASDGEFIVAIGDNKIRRKLFPTHTFAGFFIFHSFSHFSKPQIFFSRNREVQKHKFENKVQKQLRKKVEKKSEIFFGKIHTKSWWSTHKSWWRGFYRETGGGFQNPEKNLVNLRSTNPGNS